MNINILECQTRSPELQTDLYDNLIRTVMRNVLVISLILRAFAKKERVNFTECRTRTLIDSDLIRLYAETKANML